MKFLLGTKEQMTQVYDDEGKVHPVTALSVSPIKVVQIKTTDVDGYEAVQVGHGERREALLNKPFKGHVKKLGNFRTLKEFRTEAGELKIGDEINIDTFAEGDIVQVSAISKGKGFQGVVKRHNFAGGRRSHGQKHSEREPGSIGATGPQRVLKGTKMGGRMGSDRVTVKGLRVMKIDQEAGLIYIKGAVPGRRGTLVEIREANFKQKIDKLNSKA